VPNDPRRSYDDTGRLLFENGVTTTDASPETFCRWFSERYVAPILDLADRWASQMRNL
jgi:hypothetical protein